MSVETSGQSVSPTASPPARTPGDKSAGRDPRVAALGDLYPFASHYLDIDEHRMHYLDEGDGPPVLMLHGNPTWSFYYRDLIKGLRDRYRIIACDHIGCGLSDKPQDYPYTLNSHIANVERLVDHLRLGGVTLAVHDWGGAIGFGLAVRRSELIHRFVVFNTAAFWRGRLPLRIGVCRIPVLGTLAVRGLNGFARAATFMACAKRERMTPAVKRGYLLPYDSFANRVAVHRFVKDIPTRPGHVSYGTLAEIEAGLSGLGDRPMTILWGMKDFCFTAKFLDEWTKRFPAAEVHRFADAGHYVVEDAHERILPVLKTFLDQSS